MAFDKYGDELVASLVALSPGDEKEIRDAIKTETDPDGAFAKDLEETGSSLLDAESFDSSNGLQIKFHATVVMPAPIVRANTCYQGNTATWDFTPSDLYGRGFEMRVEARSP
jgi:hypothetical protein